jgi:hypothetical protein
MEVCHHACQFRGCTWTYKHEVKSGSPPDEYWKFCPEHAMQKASCINFNRKAFDARNKTKILEANQNSQVQEVSEKRRTEDTRTLRLCPLSPPDNLREPCALALAAWSDATEEMYLLS